MTFVSPVSVCLLLEWLFSSRVGSAEILRSWYPLEHGRKLPPRTPMHPVTSSPRANSSPRPARWGLRAGAMHAPVTRLILVVVVLAVIGQLILGSIDFDAPFADPLQAARIKERLGKHAEALALLEHYTQSHPDRPKGFLALGNLLLTSTGDGVLTRAATAFHAGAFGVGPPPTTVAERLQPTMAPVTSDSMTALRQAALLAGVRGQDADATALLNQAVAGGDEAALRILALTAVGRGRPTANALLQAAILKSPSDAALLLAVATLWTDSTQPAQATRYLRPLGDAPEARPGADAWTLYGAARLYAAQGDDARAAACLGSAQGPVDPTHLERALPITRQDLEQDGAFRAAGTRLRAVIMQWPTQAPWAGRS